MPKAKRAKQKLPDWAKNPEKYQYEKGTHVIDVRPKVIKGKNKVVRPQPWNAGTVLKTKW